AIAGGRLFHAVAVEDLNLVQAFELDPGVGAPGDEEFQVHFDVAELLLGDEIARPALGPVPEDTAARLGSKHARIFRLKLDAAYDSPPGRRLLQGTQSGKIGPAITARRARTR